MCIRSAFGAPSSVCTTRHGWMEAANNMFNDAKKRVWGARHELKYTSVSRLTMPEIEFNRRNGCSTQAMPTMWPGKWRYASGIRDKDADASQTGKPKSTHEVLQNCRPTLFNDLQHCGRDLSVNRCQVSSVKGETAHHHNLVLPSKYLHHVQALLVYKILHKV